MGVFRQTAAHLKKCAGFYLHISYIWAQCQPVPEAAMRETACHIALKIHVRGRVTVKTVLPDMRS